MQITFINVGYGDAILFQCANGCTILLDGGSALESEFAGDPFRVRCADFLRQRDIRRLDAVIISHIHEDHVCGLEPVFQQIPVGRIFVPYPLEPFLEGRELRPAPDAFRSVPLYTNALNAYRRILMQASERGVPISVTSPGDSLRLSPDLLVQTLAPRPAALQAYVELLRRAYAAENGGEAVTDCLTKLDAMSNQTSLLLRIEAEKTVFLSAADSCPREWTEVPSFLLENV
ncbi:MAG: MBL fold metallo-hydrolase, partial [Dysosmobacter sp.]|nr:MBL fold metallo-hydrolase [Dysosmobacter sp.]